MCSTAQTDESLGQPAPADAVPSASPRPVPKTRGRRRRALALLAAVGLASATAAGCWIWSVQTGLERARGAVADGDWALVRSRLAGFVRWHPEHAAAQLLMAEALIKDDTAKPRDYLEQAIGHLQQIPDGAPLAAQARLQEARLNLLLLKQPARAERLLEAALASDTDLHEANLLMWKLLDLTGRHSVSHEFFWRAYESSPAAERPQRLRDWFLSEFYPETANAAFYSALNAERIGPIPASVNLLVRFRESEPDATFVHAALAAYYLEHGVPQSSLELLKEAPDLALAMEDPFFVAVLFEALVDLGEFEKAATCFEQFPSPQTGYVFWRCQGMYRQHVQNDAAGAVDAYRQALTTPSAKFDWGLRTRLAECLRKTGRLDEAAAEQSRVDYLTTQILTKEKTSGLRDRLYELDDPAVAEDVRDLYRELGLDKEASAWEEHRQNVLRHDRAVDSNSQSPILQPLPFTKDSP